MSIETTNRTPTILLTGSSGFVGQSIGRALERAGWSVRPFDLAQGQDLHDPDAVMTAMRGCVSVVHAGAIASNDAGSPVEILTTNTLGTWHVLVAAEAHSLSRVVYLFSVQVFGFSEGEGTPAYVPVDDAHPLNASRPYGLSKLLAEQMCQAWTTRTGIPTVVLRPVMILDDSMLRSWSPKNAALGAFVHVEDVAAAVVAALTVDIEGHHRLTLCGPGSFDSTLARETLGWRAQHTWPESPRTRRPRARRESHAS